MGDTLCHGMSKYVGIGFTMSSAKLLKNAIELKMLKIKRPSDLNLGIDKQNDLQGVVQNCHHFHEHTQSVLGERVNGGFKMLIMMHCIFTLLVKREGVIKKSTPRKVFDIVDNSRQWSVRSKFSHGRLLSVTSELFVQETDR